MDLRGITWIYMRIYGVLHGFIWNYMDLRQFKKIYKDINEFTGNNMDLHRFTGIYMDRISPNRFTDFIFQGKFSANCLTNFYPI